MKISDVKNSQVNSIQFMNQQQEQSAEKALEPSKRYDTIEISEEGRIVANQLTENSIETKNIIEENQNLEKSEETGDAETEQKKGIVAFNAAKRARQLAAASTQEQVRAVLELLRTDLSDCKAGVKNEMCTEEEVRKVEAMIESANKRMSQVAQECNDEPKDEMEKAADELAFNMASLM